MKSFILLCFIFVSSVLQASLFNCQSTARCERITEFQTLKNGLLTIGTSFANPPFEYLEKGKKMGFEIVVLNALCKRLQLQCRFVETPSEELISGLEKQAFDVIVGSLSITPERQKTIHFSEPLLMVPLSLLTNPKINPDINSLERLKGRSVAIQGMMTQEKMIVQMQRKKQFGDLKVFSSTDLEDVALSVQKGDIDALLLLKPTGEWVADHFQGLTIVQVVERYAFPIGIAVKDNEPLLNAINQVLSSMKADGSYELIYKKWFIK